MFVYTRSGLVPAYFLGVLDKCLPTTQVKVKPSSEKKYWLQLFYKCLQFMHYFVMDSGIFQNASHKVQIVYFSPTHYEGGPSCTACPDGHRILSSLPWKTCFSATTRNRMTCMISAMPSLKWLGHLSSTRRQNWDVFPERSFHFWPSLQVRVGP